MVRQGRSVSPIFEAPGAKVAIFWVDWLHCVDLSIAADWLGEFLVCVLPKLPGRSHAARISVLRQRVQALYRRFPCDSKIDVLTANRLSPDTEDQVPWCRVSWPRASGGPTCRRSFGSSRRDGSPCESGHRLPRELLRLSVPAPAKEENGSAFFFLMVASLMW